ncbi:MAG: outer membrane beta-barrel protein [Rhizobiales bacterium]|nr:outer membrane beta-barrel protein [Hyphomicrobiales bacterium]
MRSATHFVCRLVTALLVLLALETQPASAQTRTSTRAETAGQFGSQAESGTSGLTGSLDPLVPSSGPARRTLEGNPDAATDVGEPAPLGFDNAGLRSSFGSLDPARSGRDAETGAPRSDADALDEFEEDGDDAANLGDGSDPRLGLENMVPPAPEDGLGEPVEPTAPLDGDLASYEADQPPRPSPDGFGAPLTRDGAIRPIESATGLDDGLRREAGPLAVLPARHAFGEPERLPALTTDQPALDERDARNAGLEEDRPFAPLGWRYGSFVLRPSLEASGLATDNVRASSGTADADTALELRPAFTITSDWRRHALEVDVEGLATFHAGFPEEDDRALRAIARARIDIREDTALTGELRYELQQEARGELESGATGAGERPNIETFAASLALDRRFNRLDVGLRAGLERFDDALVTAGGVPATGNERDYLEVVGGARAALNLKPGLSLFVEGESNDRDYALATFDDGFTRDHRRERLVAGIEGELSRAVLTGRAAVGYGRIRPDEASFGQLDGIVVDASLTWLPSALTTVRLRGASELEPTTLAGSPGSRTTAYALEIEHAFRRYFLATAGLAYGTQDYEGVDIEESELAAFVAAEYFLRRGLTVTARLEHTSFQSSLPDRDYDVSSVRLGMRVAP